MMKYTTRNILLFVPNIIDYVRIVLILTSFWYVSDCYKTASICYFLSVVLDEFDGMAARKFKQCSRVGAVLDLVTDMLGNAGLCMALAHIYPRYMILFQIRVLIEVGSHWLYMHSTLLCGIYSHKDMTTVSNNLLNAYYTTILGSYVLVYGNEIFFIMLYLLHFTEGPLVMGVGIVRAALYLFVPITISKVIVSVVQLVYAVNRIATFDANELNAQQ